MKLIKSITIVLSLGWPIFLMAFAYRASIKEIIILFTAIMTGGAIITWLGV